MELNEIQVLIKIASSAVVTFTTQQNLERIAAIRENIEEMAADTVDFANELFADSKATAKIVEAIFLDVMTTAGVPTPKLRTRSLDKEALALLRQAIQKEFEEKRPKVKEDGKTVVE